MDIAQRVGWFSPKRIMKLYDGKKAAFGSRRLFIIGIGANGADCLVKCKDIAQNRYNLDKSKLRFLGVGLKELLDEAECEGSVLDADERLDIDPDEAIYPYLNDPATLSPYAKDWFDEGLRNYTPNKPAYGLTKRQCARVALFHCFDRIKKTFEDAARGFASEKSPLEIVFAGNLGDAFFGGMFIDLAYIAREVFNSAEYAVSVNAYMLAGDTALLQGLDGRDLAIFYANTVVTKSELDKFQFQKKEYVQSFNDSYKITSDKPPFQSCTINSADTTYELTLENTALKIMSGCAVLFRQDDDAERLLSYNMLGNSEKHYFRYIGSGAAIDEVPVGKIVSYITLKLLVNINGMLINNSAGEMELGIIGSKVTPDSMLLAMKAGEVPRMEFDETRNPLFSMKSLKNGSEASKNYVNERLETIAELCKEGAKIYPDEAFRHVYNICEQARSDLDKGPYYAAEIVRKCLSDLKAAIVHTETELDGIDTLMSHEEKLLQAEYRRLKGTFGLFGAKTNEAYIEQLKKYADSRRFRLTGQTLLDFYNELYKRLNDYYTNDLMNLTRLFGEAIDYFNRLPSEFAAEHGGFVHDAFDFSDEKIFDKLNQMAEAIPQSAYLHAFKHSKLLASEDDPAHFAREAVAITKACLEGILAINYDEFCTLFGVEKTAANALEECVERVSADTPAEDGTPLERAICPKGVKKAELADLKAIHNSLNFIWNDSALLHTVIVLQVKGGVRLDGFKDYEQWENMRYAYVNDSLKKHGIHIFN